mmetsp:Transcript_17388/g.44175  ORF Transcript_17388/g.44175 Transcript_17388/m.44175 type:complete len:218 (+) Transcript_17388:935-1588(+)
MLVGFSDVGVQPGVEHQACTVAPCSDRRRAPVELMVGHPHHLRHAPHRTGAGALQPGLHHRVRRRRPGHPQAPLRRFRRGKRDVVGVPQRRPSMDRGRELGSRCPGGDPVVRDSSGIDNPQDGLGPREERGGGVVREGEGGVLLQGHCERELVVVDGIDVEVGSRAGPTASTGAGLDSSDDRLQRLLGIHRTRDGQRPALQSNRRPCWQGDLCSLRL